MVDDVGQLLDVEPASGQVTGDEQIRGRIAQVPIPCRVVLRPSRRELTITPPPIAVPDLLHEGAVSERRLPRSCHPGAGWVYQLRTLMACFCFAWLLTVSMRVAHQHGGITPAWLVGVLAKHNRHLLNRETSSRIPMPGV